MIRGEVPGTGIPLTFIDTPGLEPSAGRPQRWGGVFVYLCGPSVRPIGAAYLCSTGG